MVDVATRKKLIEAKGIDEIDAVLDTATWQTHARCLRHPFQPGGCKLPVGIDLVFRLDKYSAAVSFENLELSC